MKRVIAIHLPQYYPFPENDEWWGKGFTEWTNVTRGLPRFKGHYQPHLPSDLGFYDLRLKDCRMAQEKLAREYGIHGFCYYHYWFNGHLIMEKPVEAKLVNPDEELPFMLCWANSNWSRNWVAGKNETLISQNYSEEDDRKHFEYLLKFFKDPRYIKIDGKPVFCVYRASLFPDFDKTCSLWKELAKQNGFELYLCHFEAIDEWGEKYMTPNVDAAVEFQPHNLAGFNRSHNIVSEIFRKLLKREVFPRVYDYSQYVDFRCRLPVSCGYKRYPSLFPCWDNACRRVGQAFMCFKNTKPLIFEKWFDKIYNEFQPYSEDENLIFINAWNEWAEGCHLEPDVKYGRGFLEAIRKVIKQ